MTMYILIFYVLLIEFISCQKNEGQLCYTSLKAMY